MEPIDNSALLNQAITITDAANRLLEKLQNDVVRDTPAKERTYNMICFIIEQQSLAIRRLVEHTAQMNDEINKIIEKHPHL